MPRATVLPLMHGSTSPSKNGWPACSQRQRSRTLATARRTLSARGSIPKSRSSCSVGSVDVHGWPGSSSAWSKYRAGKHAPPAHWPSSPCNASSLAPHPSLATRARSAATTSAGAWTRSRNTCQRMAGSESSSQSSTGHAVEYNARTPPERAVMNPFVSRAMATWPLLFCLLLAACTQPAPASTAPASLDDLATRSLAKIDGDLKVPGLEGAGRDHPRPGGHPAHLREERRRPVLRAGLRDGAGPALAARDVAPLARGAARRGLRAEGVRLSTPARA